jgi:hypothetical protein
MLLKHCAMVILASGWLLRPVAERRSHARHVAPWLNHHQSIAAAHVSNGAAAALPTPGTILTVADTNRHGSAANPQPSIGNTTAPAIRHATSRAYDL